MFINNSIKKGILISVIAAPNFLLADYSHMQKPSITVWNVNSSNKSIEIPINPKYKGNYNYTVNWGDGSISKNVHKSITHTYSKDEKYTVKISGAFPAIYLNNDGKNFNNFNYVGNSDKLIEIKQWGNIKWKSFKNAFAGANDLKIIATDTPNLKNVKDMSGAFADNNTNTFNNINKWDVSNVTDMNNMFKSAGAFNQPLNKWDVSNVTDMSNMFANANLFNQPLDKWDVSNVTNMSGMFDMATSFNQNISKWDVSNVTDMNEMFANAWSFDQPLNNWNVSNVTDMNNMFYNAEAFNQPLDKWDVSNVTNMSGMFEMATPFNQNISKWDVSNVTNYKYFAPGCPIDSTSKMPNFDKLSGEDYYHKGFKAFKNKNYAESKKLFSKACKMGNKAGCKSYTILNKAGY